MCHAGLLVFIPFLRTRISFQGLILPDTILSICLLHVFLKCVVMLAAIAQCPFGCVLLFWPNLVCVIGIWIPPESFWARSMFVATDMCFLSRLAVPSDSKVYLNTVILRCMTAASGPAKSNMWVIHVGLCTGKVVRTICAPELGGLTIGQ